MKFDLPRETLLSAVSRVTSIVARNATMPILAHLHVQAKDDQLTFTGTDLEVEMVASCPANIEEPGDLTLPARKLFDILRALPDGTRVKFASKGDMVTVQAGRSRFVLSSLPSSDFPITEDIQFTDRLTLPQSKLSELLDRTAFAAGQNDVRHYLNGVLLETRPGLLRCVATDGHRLATHDVPADGITQAAQALVPRKGVQELMRILGDSDEEITLELGRNNVRITSGRTVLTSRLIEGRYPDYEAVIPNGHTNEIKVVKADLHGALARAAILAHEQNRVVRLEFTPDTLSITAANVQQEDALEVIDAQTQLAEGRLMVGFRVEYVMQALSAFESEHVVFKLGAGDRSGLIVEPGSNACRQVIMPVRL